VCWLASPMQVRCSSHVSVGGNTHLAQDFRTMAERSFSLFGRTGRPALQVTCLHAELVIVLIDGTGCWRRHSRLCQIVSVQRGSAACTRVCLCSQPCAVFYAPVTGRRCCAQFAPRYCSYRTYSRSLLFPCVDLLVHSAAAPPRHLN